MTFDVQETKIEHTTGFTYYMYENDLCFEVESKINNFEYTVELTTAYLECYKNLIASLDDFGQFSEWDSASAEKPFSQYAKFFDGCELSSEVTTTLKTYQPFKERPADEKDKQWYTNIQWLGSGTNDAQCYPGNIVRLIHIWEVNRTAEAAAAVGYSDGPAKVGYTNAQIDA